MIHLTFAGLYLPSWLTFRLRFSKALPTSKMIRPDLPPAQGVVMPLSAMQAARKVCEHGSWKVTNLSLQKTLYIAQMLFMGENNGARLIDASFEAWDYGPVLPDVYRRVRMFGANPIQDIFFNEPRFINDGLREIHLHNTCTFLADKKPGELVAITHWKHGAWARHYRPGVLGVPIPDRDIVDEYRLRTAERAS